MDEMARIDYWASNMYKSLREMLEKNPLPDGEGAEFGGSNGIIQSMCPNITWTNLPYPPYDIMAESSYEREWDVIVANVVLEHILYPWEALRLIGEHAKAAIVTVPFMCGIHMRPRDYWRMTPRALKKIAAPYFSIVDVGSWGTPKATYWHALYNRTSKLLASVPEEELEAELASNWDQHPFLIWAIMRK